ncbi:helix-turn-helix domain-containing protein [Microbacterium sp. NPDC057407]|uniref:helix-turn-helix domain-containing protein n=1 Tax=Microbacterium sp. NPDC057407 TaxID=3346120 RepID=UPI00366D8CB3
MYDTAYAMSAPHEHDDIEINIGESDLVYVQGGRTLDIPAGRPSLFWASRPHQLVTGGAVRLMWITVPTATVLSWAPRLGHRLLSGDVVVGGAESLPPALAETAARWSGELRRRSTESERAAHLEIEALVRRIAETAEASAPGGRSRNDPARVGAMARFVAEHFAEPILLTDVARAVHVHPNTAAREFREVMGTSIPRYIAQFRLAEAQRLLLTSSLPVDAVRRASGFASATAFHETFRATVGATPREYRRAAGGDTAPSVGG